MVVAALCGVLVVWLALEVGLGITRVALAIVRRGSRA
jgi:hypothetical protein